MPPARGKALTVTVLTTDESLPDAAQAAAIIHGVLTHTKQTAWADLVSNSADPGVLSLASSLFLSPEQASLVEAWPGVAYAMRRKDGEAPRVTVAVCVECEEWIAVTSTAPSSCQMIDGCTGKYVKPRDASRKKVPFDEAPVRDDAAIDAGALPSPEESVYLG